MSIISLDTDKIYDLDPIKKIKSQSVYKMNSNNMQSNAKLNNLLKAQSSFQLKINASDLKGSDPNKSDNANSDLRYFPILKNPLLTHYYIESK